MPKATFVFVLVLTVMLAACDTLNQTATETEDVAYEQRCPELVPIEDGQVRVLVSSSNTKELWLTQMEAEFNEQAVTTERGQQVVVQVWHTGSGLDEICQPAAWSPSDDTRIAPVNDDWREREAFPLIGDDCPSTVQIPIGIAMWRPMAEALGWPDAELRWADIIELATNPDGWGAYGHPEWGRFLYGHGDPAFSTSGRLSIVTQVYAATGGNGVLTHDDVWSDAAQAGVAAVQSAIGSYGRIDTLLLDNMAEHGPTYLHAITNYEGNVVRWNREKFIEREAPWNQLAFIYPADGTFWVDHPFCVLDNALWASPGQIEGARLFRDFIMERPQQTQLIMTGIRPGVDDIRLDIDNSPMTLDNGVIPDITAEDVPPLRYPSASVMQEVIAMWEANKKRVTMGLLLDRSDSMQPYFDPVRDGLVGFIDAFNNQDEIVLMHFGGGQYLFRPIDRLTVTREDMRGVLNGMSTGGDSPLYGTAMELVRRVSAMRGDDLNHDESRLYGLIVVSTGTNTDDLTAEDLYEVLPDGTQADQVRVHVIALADGAQDPVLQALARRTNGSFYPATSANIAEVLEWLSAEF